MGSTYFGHYYAHHQELATSNIQQTKNETTDVVINIIVVSFLMMGIVVSETR